MAELDDIRVALRLELDQFKQDLRKAQGEVKNAGEGMANSMKGFSGALGLLRGTLGALGVGFTMKHIWDQFAEGERAAIGLRLAFRNTGRGGEEMSSDMLRLADSVGKVGIVSSTSLKQGIAVLASYTAISNKDMPRSIEVMTDLAAQTGSTETAARMLGLASEGMTQQFRRHGIALSGTATESKNYAIILDEVGRKTKDANRLYGEAASGSMPRLMNAANDTAEAFGKLVAEPVAEILGGWAAGFRLLQEAMDALHMPSFKSMMDDARLLVSDVIENSVNLARRGLSPQTALLAAIGTEITRRAQHDIANLTGPETGPVTAGSNTGTAAQGVEGSFKQTAPQTMIEQAKQIRNSLNMTIGIVEQLKEAQKVLDVFKALPETSPDKKKFTTADFKMLEEKLWRGKRDAVMQVLTGMQDEAAGIEDEITKNLEVQSDRRIGVRAREYTIAREKLIKDVGVESKQVAELDATFQSLAETMAKQKVEIITQDELQKNKEYLSLVQQISSEEASLINDYVVAAQIRYQSRMRELEMMEQELSLTRGLKDEDRARREDAIAQMKTQAGKRLKKEQQSPLQNLADDWANTTTQMEAATAKWAQNSADAIVNFAKTGKFEFKSFASSIIEDLFRIGVQQALLGNTKGSIGGLFGMLGFGGKGGGFDTEAVAGFAHGGEPTINRVSLVGERGPELIAPKTAMMVTPMNKLQGGGGGQTVVVNTTNNFSLGVQQTVRAEIQSMVPQLNESAKRSVMSAINRGGSFSSAVGR